MIDNVDDADDDDDDDDDTCNQSRVSIKRGHCFVKCNLTKKPDLIKSKQFVVSRLIRPL